MSSTPTGIASSTRGLRTGWGWFVALGVLLLALALLAFTNVLAATVASVFYIGAFMLIGGITQFVQAFQISRWSGFVLWLLSGLLYATAGFVAFSDPLLLAAALTLLLAAALLVAGILRIVVGLRMRQTDPGWGWLVGSGAVSALAGLVFVLDWPLDSLWLLGMVLAVDLTVQGIASIAFGLALKNAPPALDRV